MNDVLFQAAILHCLALFSQTPTHYDRCFREMRECYLPAYGLSVKTATRAVEACALKQVPSEVRK